MAGFCLLVGVTSAPPTATTDAVFTDAEYTTASFTAATLAPPQIQSVSCAQSLLNGGTVTVTWRWLSNAAPYDSFTSNNAQWELSSGWQPVSTSSNAGLYTTIFNQGLLTGLISGVVGGSFTVPVRTAVGSKWVSGTTSGFTYKNSLLGLLLGPTCSFANGA